jgi:uncharacterized peroxidase-related enzyme
VSCKIPVGAGRYDQSENLRFFVTCAVNQDLGGPHLGRLFQKEALGTKPVFRISGHPWEGEMGKSREPNRILPVDPQQTSGKTPGLFDQVRARLGLVPNLFRVLANAPVALEGYLNFSEALAWGTLDGRIREQIALAVAESNLCSYCLNAHASLGRQAGLAPDEIASAIRASAADPHTDAVLKIVRAIVVQRGEVSDADLQHARAAGVTDGELVETVANIALNIFTNYINHVARTAIDFPEFKPFDAAEEESDT